MSLRAAGIEAFGGDVAFLELPEPPPLETGQVLIEVKAAGVGNWEEFVRTGGWDVGRVPPLALGVEAAGEVVGVGPEVEWPAAGAAVMTHPLPLPYQGCWAERLVAPAHLVAEKPSNASWAEAAAFPVPHWRLSRSCPSEPAIRSHGPPKRSRRRSKEAAAPSTSNHERVALARTGAGNRRDGRCLRVNGRCVRSSGPQRARSASANTCAGRRRTSNSPSAALRAPNSSARSTPM